jgi:hypothetical protein
LKPFPISVSTMARIVLFWHSRSAGKSRTLANLHLQLFVTSIDWYSFINWNDFQELFSLLHESFCLDIRKRL